MLSTQLWCFWLARLVGALIATHLGSTLPAHEPLDSMVEALRERGAYQEAVDYLDWLQTAAVVDRTTQEGIPGELARLALDQARATISLQRKRTLLADAERNVTDLAKRHPDHPLARSADFLRGAIALEKIPLASDVTAARAQVAIAERELTHAKERITGDLAALPLASGSPSDEMRQRHQQLMGQQAEVALLLAHCQYETARTHPASSAEANRAYRAAAKEYGVLTTKYRRIAVGLYAHLREGRCFQALGDFRQAVGCFQDLLELTERDPQIVHLQSQALRSLVECWTSDELHLEAQAIERGEQWLRKLGESSAEPEAVAIHFAVAAAADKLAASATPESERSRQLGVVKKHAAIAAAQPGEFQKPARILLAKAGGKEKEAEPKNFDQAWQQSQETYQKAQEAATEVRLLQQDTDKSTSPAALEKSLQEKQRLVEQTEQQTRAALELAAADTSREKLRAAKLVLCLLAWEREAYAEADKVGNELAEQTEDPNAARQAARICLWSRARLYNAAPIEQRTELAKGIEAMATTILKRWPKEEESAEAASLLVNIELQNQHFAKAAEYLKLVPAKSPQRSAAALQIGQATWRSLHQPPSSAQPKLSAQEQQAQRTLARQYLEEGVRGLLDQGTASPVLVDGLLSLVQALVELEDFEKANQYLTQPKFGLLTLLQAGNAAAQRASYPLEIHRLALRTFLGKVPPDMIQAEKALKSLDEWSAKQHDPQVQRSVEQLCLGLGKQLQKQLATHDKARQKEQVSQLARGIELLLKRVDLNSEQPYPVMVWIAETRFDLAEAHDQPADLPGKLSGNVSQAYEDACKAFQKIIDRAEATPTYLPAGTTLASAYLRQAVCWRRLGKFDEATLAVLKVLRDQPANLSAQIEGAMTMHVRGALEPRYYAFAIQGREQDKKGQNQIWGWAKLSKVAFGYLDKDPKIADIFFQARYRLTEARYEFGLQESDEAKRAKIIADAKSELKQTYLFKSTLGGAEWTARFDGLLRRIQASLKEPTVGLKELAEPKNANTPPAQEP